MFLQAAPPVAILAVLASMGAAAQSTAAPPTVTRAAELIARAAHVRTRPAERAELLEQASALLPDDDPRASGTLHAAAQTLYGMHQYRRALALLDCAGDLAFERGSFSEAADIYFEGAFIAREINAKEEARHFLDRAFSLTNNSGLPEHEKLRIKRRIDGIAHVRASA